MDAAVRQGILDTAAALGMDPVTLATIMSYETGGTFDPSQRGPRTKWGQHRGLIQFGEPQARQYGVNWDDPIASQLGPEGAVYKYFIDRGWKPGMSEMDAYSIVNAGGPGRYNARDSGTTVRHKVETQFAPHRRKVVSLFDGDATYAAPTDRVIKYDPKLGPEGAIDYNLATNAERAKAAATPTSEKPDVSLEARDERYAAQNPVVAAAPPAKPNVQKGWLDAMAKGLEGFAQAPAWKPSPPPKAMPTTMTPTMMQPTFDAQGAEMQRQQLAQALARLNSGQLWLGA